MNVTVYITLFHYSQKMGNKQREVVSQIHRLFSEQPREEQVSIQTEYWAK